MIDVLVVDDDFRVCKIHCGYVSRVPGFQVVGTARTGQEALAAAEELEPTLILLDLYLPDMFGLDVVTRLRASGRDCDVLVISAAREAEAVRGAVRQGAVNYLLKPFGFDDLRRRLEQYAAQRANLSAAHVRDQADIDRVLGATARSTVVVPKGLSAETADLVERALRAAAGTLSAAECAELVGISRVSARRYLEYLNDANKAQVSLRYAVPGRPERRYRWIGAGQPER